MPSELSWRIVPRQVVIPPTDQPHRPRPSHHLADPTLILPCQTRLGPRLDLAHLRHICRNELVIRRFVNRVDIEDVEWIGALCERCGRPKERGFGAATGFREERGFVKVDRAIQLVEGGGRRYVSIHTVCSCG